MSRSQLLLCLFGLLATLLINQAEARSARRLEGEGIVGGDNADEGQFPYQISLQILGKSICGGSILSERFAITAAHCVVDEEGKFYKLPLKVVAGINDLKSKSENKVAIDVIEVFVPKEYDPTDSKKREIGDIAILKLKKDLGIEENPNLDKVKLPEDDETYVGVKATISGFGWNKVGLKVNPLTGGVEETGGVTFQKMRYAKSKVLDNKKCQSSYKEPIDEKHICAAVVQRDRKHPEGVCSGDSGGPLVYEDVQIGIVSTSPIGCIENKAPAVYTRVSKYVDFINKVVSGETDEDIRSTTLKVLA